MGVGHQQLLGRAAEQGFGVVEVDLDHQHAEHLVTVAHRGGEEVAALARGGAEAEELAGTPGQRLAEVRPEGEVAPDEGVGLAPVGRRQGQAGRVHQVDHVGAALFAHALEQLVGGADAVGVFRGAQGTAQRRQVAEDVRQRLVAAQGAAQVGDVQLEGLCALLGHLLTEVARGQMLDRPQQRCQQQGEQDQGAPTRAAEQVERQGHGGCRQGVCRHYAVRGRRRPDSLRRSFPVTAPGWLRCA
ncbi:hypothetical protein D3C81_1178610 [compost metagenome]